MDFAMGYYHWFWFAQPHPFPEELINAAPEVWFRAHTSRDPRHPGFFHPEALADYLAAARQPDTIRGMCEDYAPPRRSISSTTAQAGPPGRRCNVRCSCCGARKGGSANGTTRWRSGAQYCAAEVIGGPAESGHYVPEEAPETVLDRFARFFRLAQDRVGCGCRVISSRSGQRSSTARPRHDLRPEAGKIRLS